MPRRNRDTAGPEQPYWMLLERWNARDAAGFAALFEPDGHSIGFDGSEMHGPVQIESTLEQIFTDHETGRYVAKIRDIRFVAEDVALLRAVVGMIPAGQSDLNPDVNAIQTVLARRNSGDWQIGLLQNTPAQYHGRPHEVEALTAELRAFR
jgi:uncharacterized protein (TIGR02246 family)